MSFLLWSISLLRANGSFLGGGSSAGGGGVAIARGCMKILEVIYETRGRVFHHISKHRQVCWKNEAQPSFFNALRVLHLKQMRILGD